MIDETITLYGENIAESEIIRNCGEVLVEKKPTALYDWLVRDKTQGLFWGVCVVSHTFTRMKAYEQYLDVLYKTDFYNERNRVPIIILMVNTSTKRVSFGFQVVWHHGKATIYNKVKFRELTYRSWGTALDNLLSMDDVIKVLNTDNLKVIKHLQITKNVGGKEYFADVMYLRNLTRDYRMADKEVVDQKEKFNRFVFGIPEDEYPSDDLDAWLEEIIGKQYKIEQKKSSLLLFTTELRDLQVYRNSYLKQDNIIHFELDLEDPFQVPMGAHVSIPASVEIYFTDQRAENVFGVDFTPKLFSWNEWVEKYSEIKKMLATYSVLSTLFE